MSAAGRGIGGQQVDTIVLTPISVQISTSISAATPPTGRYLHEAFPQGATSMSSIMTTNRNSTITAPTYTRISAIAEEFGLPARIHVQGDREEREHEQQRRVHGVPHADDTNGPRRLARAAKA